MLKRALLLSAIIPGMALAAPAGKPLPASPDDIAAAVGDCWNAVSLGSVDRAQLEARGWTAGTPAARNGRPVVGVPSLHGKAGSNAIIMLVDAPELRSICTVIGVVASTEDIGKAAGAVQRTLLAVDPKVKAARSENSIVFLSLPRIAMLEPTGTKDRPATRISVAYKAAESK